MHYRPLVHLRQSRLWPGTRRRRTRCALTGPSIVPSIARQTGHLPWIPRLSSPLRSFDAANPHPRIGNNKGVVHTISRLIGIMITPSRMDTLVCKFITHGGWGLRNPPAYWGAPSEWIRSLTRLQTLDAARQLQRDACLMTSNLSVLDQYALRLHGKASDMLELLVSRHNFPSVAMDAAAPVPHVRRASTHMEAMVLWHPPHGPGGQPWTSSIRALRVPVVLPVCCKCPVDNRFFSSRHR